MSVAILDSLRAEETRLAAALSASPVFRQLEAVRASLAALVTVYEGASDKLPTQAINAVSNGRSVAAPAHEERRPERLRRASSMTTRVSDVARHLFQDTGKRYQSGAIIDALIERGIVNEKTKAIQSQVASILSHQADFENTHDSRGLGYGLVEWSATDQSVHGAHQADALGSASQARLVP